MRVNFIDSSDLYSFSSKDIKSIECHWDGLIDKYIICILTDIHKDKLPVRREENLKIATIIWDCLSDVLIENDFDDLEDTYVKSIDIVVNHKEEALLIQKNYGESSEKILELTP